MVPERSQDVCLELPEESALPVGAVCWKRPACRSGAAGPGDAPSGEPQGVLRSRRNPTAIQQPAALLPHPEMEGQAANSGLATTGWKSQVQGSAQGCWQPTCPGDAANALPAPSRWDVWALRLLYICRTPTCG